MAELELLPCGYEYECHMYEMLMPTSHNLPLLFLSYDVEKCHREVDFWPLEIKFNLIILDICVKLCHNQLVNYWVVAAKCDFWGDLDLDHQILTWKHDASSHMEA